MLVNWVRDLMAVLGVGMLGRVAVIFSGAMTTHMPLFASSERRASAVRLSSYYVRIELRTNAVLGDNTFLSIVIDIKIKKIMKLLNFAPSKKDLLHSSLE